MRFRSERQSKILSASNGEAGEVHKASLKAAQATFKKHADGARVNPRVPSAPGNSKGSMDGLVDPIAGLQLDVSGRRSKRGLVGRSLPPGGSANNINPRRISSGVSCGEYDYKVAAAAAARAARNENESIWPPTNAQHASPLLALPPLKLAGTHTRSSSNISMSTLTSGNGSHLSLDEIIATIKVNDPNSQISLKPPTSRRSTQTGAYLSSRESPRGGVDNSTESLPAGGSQYSPGRLHIPPIVINPALLGKDSQAILACSESQASPSHCSETTSPPPNTDGPVLPVRPPAVSSPIQSTYSFRSFSSNRMPRRIPPPCDPLSQLTKNEQKAVPQAAPLLESSEYSGGDSDYDGKQYSKACISETDSALEDDDDFGSGYENFSNAEDYLSSQDDFRERNDNNDNDDDDELDDDNLVESENDATMEQDSQSDDDTESAKEFTVANVSYSTLNKIPMNMTYRGTLPDLIPNYQRKQSKWMKLFKRHGQTGLGPSKNHPPTSHIYTQNDNALVQSKLHVRLKTTMRGILNDSSSSEPHQLSDDSEDSEEDYGSDRNSRSRSPGRRSGKKREKIRQNLRYRNSFNEDKPWKSHLDVGYVTERERKRYEGMWVSNRDTYLDLLPWWNNGNYDETREVPEDGLMLNLVVTDIWSRSNLPQDTLAQIYDMVDTRRDGTLDRNSFVVGMWLVDQSLYGRKLPRELDRRVWDSVDKYVINVNGSNKNPKHHHRTRKKLLKKELKLIKKESKSHNV
ncbi:AFR103Wp [Eremothecium gossypii ATCC 10895]|uniref:Increased rDNA silencing protein 4 n=1 Tax=Eremothecium gossypii (strain ATCC 10895 / CBS 109.51 / FGSC 9923 / NRRL Y-1056) TaxID=284811 RepID=IRS4_EREGS|nr:AFR103Wp [Eremothecium gossypii ATCC 10895]Q754G7.1 RecName: Full=Increased rDNA silencing protein 4 [Eremothecium gossypii ATCC 10895]AAS53474.1 AFR103Wp [Eremothecium gossypii ATCC 10895]AEY97786.1 FAFR103Wp [Eremothecium gossypii FDAG1]